LCASHSRQGSLGRRLRRVDASPRDRRSWDTTWGTRSCMRGHRAWAGTAHPARRLHLDTDPELSQFVRDYDLGGEAKRKNSKCKHAGKIHRQSVMISATSPHSTEEY
ncbi:hypothetical protein HW555_002457, partial [Spodoptera exigua]